MSEYEPRWSDEEQTMIDLMKLAGFGVVPIINREFTTIQVFTPDGGEIRVTKDTEYEAIRVAFAKWNKFKHA